MYICMHYIYPLFSTSHVASDVCQGTDTESCKCKPFSGSLLWSI